MPTSMPARLTPDSGATPLASVAAAPTAFPFSAKVMIWPASGAPDAVNVADSVTSPLNTPAAGAIDSDVTIAGDMIVTVAHEPVV